MCNATVEELKEAGFGILMGLNNVDDAVAAAAAVTAHDDCCCHYCTLLLFSILPSQNMGFTWLNAWRAPFVLVVTNYLFYHHTIFGAQWGIKRELGETHPTAIIA